MGSVSQVMEKAAEVAERVTQTGVPEIVATQSSRSKIKLEVIDDSKGHVVITFDRPGRIELTHAGSTVVHVYEKDSDEPIGMYDGNLNENKNWEV